MRFAVLTRDAALLGLVEGADGEPERATFDKFFAESDPLLASMYDAEGARYAGFELERRPVAGHGTPPEERGDGVFVA